MRLKCAFIFVSVFHMGGWSHTILFSSSLKQLRPSKIFKHSIIFIQLFFYATILKKLKIGVLNRFCGDIKNPSIWWLVRIPKKWEDEVTLLNSTSGSSNGVHFFLAPDYERVPGNWLVIQIGEGWYLSFYFFLNFLFRIPTLMGGWSHGRMKSHFIGIAF